MREIKPKPIIIRPHQMPSKLRRFLLGPGLVIALPIAIMLILQWIFGR